MAAPYAKGLSGYGTFTGGKKNKGLKNRHKRKCKGGTHTRTTALRTGLIL